MGKVSSDVKKNPSFLLRKVAILAFGKKIK